jgi:Rhodopirellula transposase DDE domain
MNPPRTGGGVLFRRETPGQSLGPHPSVAPDETRAGRHDDLDVQAQRHDRSVRGDERRDRAGVDELTDIRTIVELISATTSTRTGLTVQALYDPGWYPKGQKISNADLAALPLNTSDWHGDWNYTLNHA